MLTQNKRGQLGSNGLIAGILLLVVVAVVAVVGFSMLDGLDDDFAASSAEANATANAVTGISNVTAKLPLVATIVVSVFLLSLVIGIVALFRQ